MVHRAEAHPQAVALSRRSDTGWEDVTAAAFADAVRRTAKGLMAAGVSAGDRVALLSRTRFEWTVLDYALWCCGAAAVPIYATSPPEQIRWIVHDSGAAAAVVDTAQRAELVEQATGGTVQHLWVLDAEPSALATLARLGSSITDAELEARRRTVTPADLATIIYTSGTTGEPKGCAITHASFMWELAATSAELGELFADDHAATLLVLPMAHVFARIVQVGAIRAGVRLGHCADIGRLDRDVAEFRPTFLLGVPRVFEHLFTKASQRALSDGAGRRFDRGTDVAIAYSKAVDAGRVPPLLRARHALMDRLVYQQVRTDLGGRCRYAVCGGAPLGERLAHYFRGVGLPVLEGYGLTETTGAVTVSTPDALRVGWVGRPLPGTAARVGDDGELQVRGPQVMSGYWRNEPATQALLTADGWLRTGDLAEIDAEGFVRVTGRMEEILLTAGGKSVAPDVLEQRLREHPLVGPSVVVGDGRPYVAALITLDPESAAAWAKRNGRRADLRRLVDDPDVVAQVQEAVDRVNATVSQAESIRAFQVLPERWSEETGELTASLKLRRYVVLPRLQARIEELYAR